MSPARRRSEPTRRRTPRRPEFIAAVRFKDGETQLFSVSNASDPEDARQMVLAEVANVAALVVALR